MLAEGKAAITPASLHANGGRCRWARNGASAIAAAPRWLTALCAPPPRFQAKPNPLTGDLDRYCAASIAAELRNVEYGIEGQRNHQLNRAAFVIGGLVRAGVVPENWATAQLENRAIQIGLPPAEARPTIASAFKAAQTSELGSVDIHLSARKVATRCMAARKLVSVLSQRVAMRRNSLIFWKKFSTR